MLHDLNPGFGVISRGFFYICGMAKKLTKAEIARKKQAAIKFGYSTDTKTKNAKGKSYKQTGVTKAKKSDSKRKALEPGKRTTAWGTSYTETRKNRSDKSTKKKL